LAEAVNPQPQGAGKQLIAPAAHDFQSPGITTASIEADLRDQVSLAKSSGGLRKPEHGQTS
jgi:hypothetical protein